jgi:2-polyprenyl-3-methyl-5-hydroxy-6-metoxy-1,4-benzoquinol methylase
MDVDEKALKAYSFVVWSYKQGEIVSLMVHIGDRLGLYKTMAGAGPLSAADLADRTGLDERLLLEWLKGQAAARLIDHDDGSFELPPAGEAVLADETSSLQFSAGAFRGGAEPEVVDRIIDSFRTGVGLTYEQQGPRAAAGLARMTAPWSRIALIPTIIPALDGIADRLESGADVVDVGCGGGVTLLTIAEAFPNSRCVGYDPSEIAVEQARARAQETGLTNAEFVVAGAEDLPEEPTFDLVLTFDCLHDMPRPDRAALAIRHAIRDTGTWLIKDIRSSGDFDKDNRNPMLAMFYGFSVSSCLQSAISEPDGLGLGTLGLHANMARELVAGVGFDTFIEHDFDDTANLYYEVRP